MPERQWYTCGPDGGLVLHAVTRRVWRPPNDPFHPGAKRSVTLCGIWLWRTGGRLGDVNCMACIAAMMRRRATR